MLRRSSAVTSLIRLFQALVPFLQRLSIGEIGPQLRRFLAVVDSDHVAVAYRQFSPRLGLYDVQSMPIYWIWKLLAQQHDQTIAASFEVLER